MMFWVIWNMCHSDKIFVDWCFVSVKFCKVTFLVLYGIWMKKINCYCLTRNHNMYMCLKVPNTTVCDRKMFLIHDIPRWSYSLGMLNFLYHSPVNFSKGSMESFFTCAHFCPTYGEVTPQFQNITFMNLSEDGELRGQSHEIWYAYH